MEAGERPNINGSRKKQAFFEAAEGDLEIISKHEVSV